MIPNKKIIASILFVLISFVCTAQLPPSPSGRPPGPPGDDLPIDSSILILAAAAILYGIYKIYTFKKKQFNFLKRLISKRIFQLHQTLNLQ